MILESVRPVWRSVSRSWQFRVAPVSWSMGRRLIGTFYKFRSRWDYSRPHTSPSRSHCRIFSVFFPEFLLLDSVLVSASNWFYKQMSLWNRGQAPGLSLFTCFWLPTSTEKKKGKRLSTSGEDYVYHSCFLLSSFVYTLQYWRLCKGSSFVFLRSCSSSLFVLITLIYI